MSYFQIANELISQQDLSFKNKLVPIIERLLDCKTAKEAEKSSALKEINALLLSRTGILSELTVDTPHEPCCYPVMGNFSHALGNFMHPVFMHNGNMNLRKILAETDKNVGTLDLKNGRVGGIYSKIPAEIHFSFNYTKRAGLTAAEFGAILMHEVGHCFLAFEFMGRTYRASQVLAALHQVQTGRDDSFTFEDAITALATSLEYDSKENIERDLRIENDIARRSIVFGRVWQDLATDFGYQETAASSYERLADNFAARYGFAEEMTTGFLNTETLSSLRLSRNTRMALFFDAATWYFCRLDPVAATRNGAIAGTLTAFWLLFAGANIMAIVMIGGAIGGLALAATVVSNWVDNHQHGSIINDDEYVRQKDIYDRMSWRLGRMREAVVEQLKNLKLDPELRKQLIAQSDRMAASLKDLKDTPDLYRMAALAFSSKGRDIEATKQFERKLETLANNDLFVSGNRLKTL